jgi:biotin carboxylase
VVVKPRSLSASRGVIRADSPPAATAAAARIVAILEAEGEVVGELVVEEYVDGPEVAVEGICRSGEAAVITVFDKPDPLQGPYFEETFYVSPSRYDAGVEDLARAAVTTIGLTEGPFHAELRLGPDGPVVLEVAGRTIGGRCSKAMRFSNGWSLEELVIATALGDWPPPSLAGPCGVLMIPIPRAGTLLAVRGVEAAAAVAGITGVEITIVPGRVVRTLPEGDRYLGFVFAKGPDAAAVEASLRRADGLIEVDISPCQT